MQLEPVDERDTTVEWEQPVFRLVDWGFYDADVADRNFSTALDVRDASLQEFLEFALSDRHGDPAMTELFAVVSVDSPRGALGRVPLGHIVWHRAAEGAAQAVLVAGPAPTLPPSASSSTFGG
jgi:hypothetical protein